MFIPTVLDTEVINSCGLAAALLCSHITYWIKKNFERDKKRVPNLTIDTAKMYDDTANILSYMEKVGFKRDTFYRAKKSLIEKHFLIAFKEKATSPKIYFSLGKNHYLVKEIQTSEKISGDNNIANPVDSVVNNRQDSVDNSVDSIADNFTGLSENQIGLSENQINLSENQINAPSEPAPALGSPLPKNNEQTIEQSDSAKLNNPVQALSDIDSELPNKLSPVHNFEDFTNMGLFCFYSKNVEVNYEMNKIAKKFNFSEKFILKLIKRYSRERVWIQLHILEYASFHGKNKIKNHKAWINTALKENFTDDDAAIAYVHKDCAFIRYAELYPSLYTNELLN